jgi:hypothetical protein
VIPIWQGFRVNDGACSRRPARPDIWCPILASAPGQRPDAELIDLGRQFEEIAAALDGDNAEAALHRPAVIEPTIVAMPATTIEEIRVRARAACWALSGDRNPNRPTTTDVRMALSIVRDLIRLYDLDRERPNAVRSHGRDRARRDQELTAMHSVRDGQAVAAPERRRIWSSGPSLVVILFSIADVLIIPTLAVRSVRMAPLSVGLVAEILLAAVVLACAGGMAPSPVPPELSLGTLSQFSVSGSGDIHHPSAGSSRRL